MELLAETDDVVEQFSADIPELMWSTGSISYEYHFGTRELFNAVALDLGGTVARFLVLTLQQLRLKMDFLWALRSE